MERVFAKKRNLEEKFVEVLTSIVEPDPRLFKSKKNKEK
jgi:hypothetical protein